MMMLKKIGYMLTVMLMATLPADAQKAFDYLSQNRNLSASNFCIYPDTILQHMTPPPAGKRPFYISHYGRHGSRYLSDRKSYDIPYKMLKRADSLNLLTETGKKAIEELQLITTDSEGRWGDLTGIGKQQHRNIAQRMMRRFPEVFKGKTHIDARSTTVNRCIISMGAFTQQLAAMNPQLNITLQASKQDMWYMNHQDPRLKHGTMSKEAKKGYDTFCEGISHNPRIMQVLFTNPDSARQVVDEVWLNYYLLKSGIIQQNTHMYVNTFLIDLFTYEEIHRFWQVENAWWYIMHGPSPLSAGERPYSQRYLLRQIIQEADSCMKLPTNEVQLRFGHETVMLPLTCLLGLNGFNYVTDDLASLEEKGWWACLVFPMASNIQFVFYRNGPRDQDVIFKVLLNEQEATLPIKTDIAPYYHWRDFREHYLNMLDSYEQTRRTAQQQQE